MGQSYADAKGFKYNACATQIATSLGGVGSVVGIVDAPVRCVLNANTSVEAKARSTPATHFLVVRGVEYMYDVLVSTHCAQDWGARPDPITKLLEYRPYMAKGDLHTFAAVPLLVTSNRSWKDRAAAGVFMCNVSTHCNHAACGGSYAVHTEPVQHGSSDQTHKGAKVPRPLPVNSHEPLNQTNKRKGHRAQRDFSRGWQRRRAKIMTNTTMYGPDPSVKVGHLSVWQLLLVFVCMHSMKHFMGAEPQALPQRSRLDAFTYVPGVWEWGEIPAQVHTTGIGGCMPEGDATVPMSNNMVKDPELGVIWGNHPKADKQAREAFKSLVREKKSSAFSYSVADLGTYTGEVGDFTIDLIHSQPIMAKRRKRSPLEQQIQDEKCQELESAGHYNTSATRHKICKRMRVTS